MKELLPTTDVRLPADKPKDASSAESVGLLAAAPKVAAPALTDEDLAKVDLSKIDVEKLPKTSGERFYDVFQFFAGKVFIIAATAVLAFGADPKYGPKTILGAPNFLQKFQGWFHNKLLHNKVFPLANRGDFAALTAGALTNTMIISHGGNLFGPFVQWLENNREGIANWYNRKWGTPEEVEITHERLKDIPKQNAMDIAKGRVLTWGTVFVAMLSAYATIGKNPKNGRYWLDIYEDWFARKMAGMTKEGKEIGKIPVSQELKEVHKANAVYRFGKVLALDLYATTAGIFLWNMFSRDSARKRTEAEKLKEEYQEPLEWQIPLTKSSPEKTVAKAEPHAESARKPPETMVTGAELGTMAPEAAHAVSA